MRSYSSGRILRDIVINYPPIVNLVLSAVRPKRDFPPGADSAMAEYDRYRRCFIRQRRRSWIRWRLCCVFTAGIGTTGATVPWKMLLYEIASMRLFVWISDMPPDRTIMNFTVLSSINLARQLFKTITFRWYITMTTDLWWMPPSLKRLPHSNATWRDQTKKGTSGALV